MRARHFLSAGVIALAVMGCQDNKAKKPPAATQPSVSAESLLAQQEQQQRQGVSVDPTGSAPVAPPDDLTLLVQKTQAHAKRVTEEMQRNGTLQQAAGRQPPPSVVEWMDDGAFRMGVAQAAQGATTPPTPRPEAASPAPAPVAPAPETGTANKPVAIEDDTTAKATPQVAMLSTPLPPAPLPAADSVSLLERKLEKQVRDYPKDLAGQLDYQLLQFLQGKTAPDLSKLAALPDEDQEILNAVLDALTNFRTAVQSDSNLLLSRKVKPLMDLGERLRARADLEVPVVELCKRVDGYGVYEPVEHRFIAGQERDIIVYAEVENFMSQFNDKSHWETRLSEEVVLYTDTDGLPVLRDKATPVPDSCRNRRSDFFIVRKLRLPANIPVGRYWLKVTVVDQLASRVAEHSIPVTFVAK